MDILNEAPGFCVFLLQLAIVVFSIVCVRLAKRAVTEASKHLEEAAATLDSYPAAVAPVIWTPLMVGAVGNIFQIKPVEILSEYKKENEAKRWIVVNTFPETPLTKKFLEGPYVSKFMSLGYSFKQDDSLHDPTTTVVQSTDSSATSKK